jgi:hypothetical protein
VLDLIAEMRALRDSLQTAGIEYALCGGLAMAVHGYPRATIDIDLLVQEEDSETILSLAENLGFTFRALPMTFSAGKLRIRRITKLDPSDGSVLVLDLLIGSEELREVWETRRTVTWEGAPLKVVSPEGLIALKQLRSSAQDLADIEKLNERH